MAQTHPRIENPSVWAFERADLHSICDESLCNEAELEQIQPGDQGRHPPQAGDDEPVRSQNYPTEYELWDPTIREWPTKYARLSDQWVYRAIKLLSGRRRGRMWGHDFDVHGNIREKRVPKGRPVIIYNRGVAWYPVYRGYYILCGRQAAVQHRCWLLERVTMKVFCNTIYVGMVVARASDRGHVDTNTIFQVEDSHATFQVCRIPDWADSSRLPDWVSKAKMDIWSARTHDFALVFEQQTMQRLDTIEGFTGVDGNPPFSLKPVAAGSPEYSASTRYSETQLQPFGPAQPAAFRGMGHPTTTGTHLSNLPMVQTGFTRETPLESTRKAPDEAPDPTTTMPHPEQGYPLPGSSEVSGADLHLLLDDDFYFQLHAYMDAL